jgi:kynurenine formamidase
MLIDLSNPIENEPAVDPPGLGPSITYLDHFAGADEIVTMFPGLTKEELPDREGWAVERLTLTAHCGTHVDAPWHYASTMNEGARAQTIDELPLDWFFRPGVKLDFRHLPSGHVVTPSELVQAFARIGHELKPFEIVLMNTSAGAAYGTPAYLSSGCGFGRDATLWLCERGVVVVGTDAWSWDAPFGHTRERFREEKNPAIIWEGHKAGRHRAYCQIEKLANLEQLPADGFKVSCFPVKIKNGSAGFCRAVALTD